MFQSESPNIRKIVMPDLCIKNIYKPDESTPGIKFSDFHLFTYSHGDICVVVWFKKSF